MLRREEAAKVLERERTAQWQKVCLSAVTGLPAALRPTAYALLGCDENGEPLPSASLDAYQRQERILAEGYARLGALTAQRRLALFSALFPAAAPTVEAAWRLMARLPYQTGWQRKAFRLRGVGDTTTPAQRMWLSQLVNILGAYREKDVEWLAAWAPYLGQGYAAQPLGILFAAAIDAGTAQGEQVFETLVASARGDHPTGAMGRHVSTGLLVASRPDGWECVEKLLLAAQREEGLRQVILETVDEAHPHAFRRLLRLILDHDLTRFSATVRAANVWLGFCWDVDQACAVRDALAMALRLLEDPEARREALTAPEPLAAYLALWATAFEDAQGAIAQARPLLCDPDPERRLIAAHLLGQLALGPAREALLPLLDDPDLHVALCAFQGCGAQVGPGNGCGAQVGACPQTPDLFERLERLLARLDGQKAAAEGAAWPWLASCPGQLAQEVEPGQAL